MSGQNNTGSQDGNQTNQTQGTQNPPAQGAPTGQQQANTTNQGAGGTPASWDEVLAGLPEASRALYESHTQGLRSALESEREQRRDLARQLRDATSQLEEGSQARTALETASQQLEEANRRAEFFREAAGPEVGCTNPELAFLGATQREMFDRRGNPNWDAIKKAFPELFRSKVPATAGNAGAGTQQGPPKSFSMNEAIRAASNRNTI